MLRDVRNFLYFRTHKILRNFAEFRICIRKCETTCPDIRVFICMCEHTNFVLLHPYNFAKCEIIWKKSKLYKVMQKSASVSACANLPVQKSASKSASAPASANLRIIFIREFLKLFRTCLLPRKSFVRESGI